MNKPTYADHTFAPWRVVGDKRVVAPETTWKKPSKWDRESASAGVRRRVLIDVDAFEDWARPIHDSCGNRLHEITDGRTGLVGGTTKSKHWYSESPCDDTPEPWLTMVAVRRRLFGLIDSTPNLDWLLVTERTENIAEMVEGHWMPTEWDRTWEGHADKPQRHYEFPANLWLGVRITDQSTADERIPHLLRVPARVRFLSCEPLLGMLDLDLPRCEFHDRRYVEANDYYGEICAACAANGSTGEMPHGVWLDACAYERQAGINWVIAGGESGPHARPMHPDWVRSLRNQCTAAGVPFWFDGWGQWEPVTPLYDGRDDTLEDGTEVVMQRDGAWNDRDGQPTDNRAWLIRRVGKARAGRTLDGREWEEVPA